MYKSRFSTPNQNPIIRTYVFSCCVETKYGVIYIVKEILLCCLYIGMEKLYDPYSVYVQSVQKPSKQEVSILCKYTCANLSMVGASFRWLKERKLSCLKNRKTIILNIRHCKTTKIEVGIINGTSIMPHLSWCFKDDLPYFLHLWLYTHAMPIFSTHQSVSSLHP